MTRNLSLGSPGEFETCSDWVPTVDKRRRCARSGLKTIDVSGFDQRVNGAPKVRDVSIVGAKFPSHLLPFSAPTCGRAQSFVFRFESSLAFGKCRGWRFLGYQFHSAGPKIDLISLSP